MTACDQGCGVALVHVEARSFLVGRDRAAFLATSDYEVFRHAGCGKCDEDGMVEFDREGDGVSCAYAVRAVCDCQDECAREVWIDAAGNQIPGGPDDA